MKQSAEEHRREMRELDEEDEREQKEDREADENRRMQIIQEHIKYIRPDVSIPEEFFEAEDQEELKVTSPLKISEVLVLMPPVQRVVCFSVSVLVPQKTVVIPMTTPLIQ